MSERHPYTRREFLNSSLVFASASLAVPTFLQSSALAIARAMGDLSAPAGIPEGHVLVVVQFSGGNDGLNTVVPFGMPEYYKARPAIGIPEGQALRLDGDLGDGVGLHPQLAPLMDLYKDGLVSVVQGVGYPNPNRSHFKSMDIWQTADLNATGDGWLGRYFDSECCGFGKGESGKPEATAKAPNEGADAPGIAIGRTAPLAMQGRRIAPVSFQSADLFQWSGKDVHPALDEPYETLNRRERSAGASTGSNADFLLRTALDAQVSSDKIRKAVAAKPLTSWPRSDLANQLQMIAAMIRAGLRTRVYYAELGGFDTHANQGGPQGRHATLLGQYAAAMKAFYAELKAQGNDSRVLTMTFSEFGRRVTQNASQGTDHGTAAPVFLVGPMVRPGVASAHPSMKDRDLDAGDLKYNVDFRTVYAAILEKWMRADAKAILGADYQPAAVLKG